jgi:antagonist of KipI
MSLHVLDPGLLSLLVDTGRPRWRALGVPVGGAADRAALALGNALVGNPPDALAVEVTLAGPTLRAEHPTAGVVFGAPFQSTINGRPTPPATTFTLQLGDVLRVGGTTSGVRGYLCVAGGFDAPEVLGSRSGLEALKAGDVLACGPSRGEGRGLSFASFQASRDRQGADHDPQPLPGGRGSPILVRVLDGSQRDWFPDDRFFTQTYEVTPASNRMGLRLRGDPLTRKLGELVSEAVAPGAVQVTNDGQPVVLGVDGQTIGGYPKVAHVVRADLDLLAQLRPGEQVRFTRVSPDEAEAAARERAATLRAWLARLRAAERQPVRG